MRFYFGAPPGADDFEPEATGWRPIKEPSPWVMQFFALPLGILVAVGLGAAWVGLATVDELFPSSYAILAFEFVVLVVVHELLHTLIHPHNGRSESTILGFWPSRLLFYAYYNNVIPRNRFIMVLAFPFLAVSIMPLCLSILLGIRSSVLAFVSVFNGLLSCGDLLGALLVATQIPNTAVARNKGYRTYWKIGK